MFVRVVKWREPESWIGPCPLLFVCLSLGNSLTSVIVIYLLSEIHPVIKAIYMHAVLSVLLPTT